MCQLQRGKITALMEIIYLFVVSTYSRTNGLLHIHYKTALLLEYRKSYFENLPIKMLIGSAKVYHYEVCLARMSVSLSKCTAEE